MPSGRGSEGEPEGPGTWPPEGWNNHIPPASRSLRGRQWREAHEKMQIAGERALKRLFNQEGPDSPENQHFIPKFWLCGFAQNSHAVVLDVGGEKVTRRKKSLTQIASRDNFYTLKVVDGEDPYYVERFLGWLDGEAAAAGRWEALKNGKMVADPLSRLYVAQLLVAQMVRGPNYRRAIQSIAAVMAHDILCVGWAAGEIPPMGLAPHIEPTQEMLVTQITSMITDHEQPRQLCLRRWGLCEPPDDVGWALPMEPVVGLAAVAPLSSPVILVPINHRFLLVLEWDYTFSAHEEPEAVTLTPEGAARIRQDLIAHARRQPLVATRKLVVRPADVSQWLHWCYNPPAEGAPL